MMSDASFATSVPVTPCRVAQMYDKNVPVLDCDQSTILSDVCARRLVFVLEARRGQRAVALAFSRSQFFGLGLQYKVLR